MAIDNFFFSSQKVQGGSTVSGSTSGGGGSANNYVNSINFADGIITLGRQGLGELTSNNLDDRYYSEAEIGAIFGGITAITGYNKTSWDTAFGWGDWEVGVTKSFVDNLGINATHLGGFVASAYVRSINLADVATSGDYNDLINTPSLSTANWNTAYNRSLTGVSFNTANGILTLSKQDGSTLTQNLDGRYRTTAQTLSFTLGQLDITDGNSVNLDSRYYTEAEVDGLISGISTYSGWNVSATNGGSTLIGSGETLTFANGLNTVVTRLGNTITVDVGVINGADASTLDGIDSSQFLRSDQSDTMNGLLSVVSQDDVNLVGNGIKLVRSVGSNTGYVNVQGGAFNFVSDSIMRWRTSDGTSRMTLSSTAHDINVNTTVTGTFSATGVISGNGSGLTNVNATTLDGIDSSQFLRSDQSDTLNGNLTVTNNTYSKGNDLIVGNKSTTVWSTANRGVIEVDGASSALIGLTIGGAARAYFYHSGGETVIYSQLGDLRLTGAGSVILDDTTQVNGTLTTTGAITMQGSTVATQAYVTTQLAGYLQPSDLTNYANKTTTNTFSLHQTFDGGITLGASQTITTSGTSTRDKFRVWTDSTYTIGMQSSHNFGGLSNEYAMTFQMNNDNGRGFWWGDTVHNNSQGAMSLTTDGRLTIANSLRIGYGEGDTSAATGSYDLQVSGNVQAAFYYGDGSTLSNVVASNSSQLGGIDAVNYARLDQGNTFDGNQTIEGNLTFALGTWSISGVSGITASGNIVTSAAIKTGNPSGGTAKNWKLGSRITTGDSYVDVGYVEVEIDGAAVQLCRRTSIVPT